MKRTQSSTQAARSLPPYLSKKSRKEEKNQNLALWTNDRRHTDPIWLETLFAPGFELAIS